MKKLLILLLIFFSFLSISTPVLAANPMIACSKFDTFGLNQDGTVSSTSASYDVGSWNNIDQIAAGGYHIIALKSDGTVTTSGIQAYSSSRWYNITQVAAGGYHIAALKSDGTVDTDGEISGGGLTNVRSWTNIIQIAAGGVHTLGLKQDGTVLATDANLEGECDVDSWRNIKQISTADYYSLGVKSDGTVVATGSNYSGQCNVGSWRNIIQTACGDNHSVGLKNDGTVVATGDNAYGQCNVSSWHNIIQVAAGGGFTVGLKNDGTVISVGCDTSGKTNIDGWDLITGDNDNPDDSDNDGDGFSTVQGDCNDNDAAIHPGATEICGDGIDQDCNDSDLACVPGPNDTDNDGDGFTENQGDCKDNNATIHPGAIEICGDGIDQDCNGKDLACDSDSNDSDNGQNSGKLELIPEPPFVKTNGWLLTKIQSDTGETSYTTYYTYDSNGDLIKEEFRLSGGAASSVVNYSHESNGNFRKAEHDFDNNGTVDAITTYEYNSKGQLVKSTRDDMNMIITYFYDSNGNLVTTRTDGNGDGMAEVIQTSSYDSEGKLVKITVDTDPYPTPTSTVYEYDSEGKLIRIYSSSWSSICTYNSDGILERIAYSGSSPSSSANYTWIKSNSANDNDGNNDNNNDSDNNDDAYMDVAGGYAIQIQSKLSVKKLGKYSNTSTGQLTLQDDGSFNLNNYSTSNAMAGTFEIDSKGKKFSITPSGSGLAALENTLITWLEETAANEGIYLTGLDYTFLKIKTSKVKIDKNTGRATGKISLSASGTVSGCIDGDDCATTKFTYQAKISIY